MDVGTHPLAKAELASRAEFRAQETAVEEGQLDFKRVQLAVVAKSISYIGYIAGAPVTHNNFPEVESSFAQKPIDCSCSG